jgi:hypothetical protein
MDKVRNRHCNNSNVSLDEPRLSTMNVGRLPAFYGGGQSLDPASSDTIGYGVEILGVTHRGVGNP